MVGRMSTAVIATRSENAFDLRVSGSRLHGSEPPIAPRLPVHNSQHHFLNPRLSALILETYEWVSQLSKIQAVL